ncbi:MAG: DUF2905 domain-containing protein [Candidatus Marinimicrobia bacterium]|jgi:hypothetical protein|nr:hypothetical protein [Candidatus Neomarinimicrobiota bacterium]MDP6456147.1 DUF2905 domain-containing protein [Candidatus Neomarinimicrobiota bacterium]MDP6593681.1 DUF2905 domain-containing protein [Candidatus Neomarinimicrobiota bacterium]MDP6836358.1 DUF2905 domain-containing protein [Candidatus Neomarinimicrobiota bacterium]MDP6967208.1 DUF2905 domain-containing protein [Candidatus Neomarinimicrobiota bacterium]|tara:strand:- start:214 stop:435 length:222 start_codon:yes stop_codon:yes gene_type:complete
MMLGKLFLLLSIVFFAMWLLTTYGQTIPILGKLGHLPGDIRVERNGLSLYLPIGSSIVISIVLTVVLRLLSKI